MWLVYSTGVSGHGGREGHEARGAVGDQFVKGVLNPAGRAYCAVRFAFCPIRNEIQWSRF